MTANLRKCSRIGDAGNRCMTITEAMDALEAIGEQHGFDALLMSQSWPVGEFRVYEDDPEDEEAARAPKIVEVVLDQRVAQQKGWSGE